MLRMIKIDDPEFVIEWQDGPPVDVAHVEGNLKNIAVHFGVPIQRIRWEFFVVIDDPDLGQVMFDLAVIEHDWDGTEPTEQEANAVVSADSGMAMYVNNTADDEAIKRFAETRLPETNRAFVY